MAYATPAMMREVHAQVAAASASASTSSSSSSSSSSSVIPVATAAVASSGASIPPHKAAPMSRSVFVFPTSASDTPAAAAALPASGSLDLPADPAFMSQSMILPTTKTQQVAAAALPAYSWPLSSSSASVVILPSQQSKPIALKEVFDQAKKSLNKALTKKNASSQTICNALTGLNEQCVKAITAAGFTLSDPSYEFQKVGQFGITWLVMVEPLDSNATTCVWQVAPNQDQSPFEASESLRAALHTGSWKEVTVTGTCQFTKPDPHDPVKKIRDLRAQTFTVFPDGTVI